jgi:nucleotide-binding universal stress UspA family protein
MNRARVVVGADGSAAGTAAVRWAATEARLRDTDLEVILAYRWQMPGRHFTTSGALQRAADEQARSIIEASVAHARSAAPGLAVHGTAVLGYPAEVLLKSARDAELLVVGSRGLGGFRGLLLGSVGAQVATHASCPVVVVRGRATTTGPVVVGVDESASARVATALAFEETAVRRHAMLLAVTAYTAPLLPMTIGTPPLGYDQSELETVIRRSQAVELAEWREKYPDVVVDGEVVTGNPAEVLVAKSRHAQLVVVGTHSQGAVGALLLGSVGLRLLHHADCPVLVARR